VIEPGLGNDEQILSPAKGESKGVRMNLISKITCPHRGRDAAERMPVDACQIIYECKACGSVLKPKAGDCCVFCSYGDVPCTPVQLVNHI
jgi:hypothetical protein